MASAQFLIHRRRRKETTVDNSIIWDRSLSNMARFALIAILSLPDGWDYSVRGMASMLQVSKDTMGKYLRELEEAGYLRRQQGDDRGKFSKSVYTITDTPGEFGDEDPPCPKNYDSDCPNFSDPKKSPQKNLKVLDNNNIPTTPQRGDSGRRRKREPKEAPDWKPERFAGLWAYYPKKGRKNKQDAMRAWDELGAMDDLIDKIGRALKKLKASEEWQRGVGIPYVATFLRGRRWEDAEAVDEPDPVAREGDAAYEDRRLL